MPSITWRGFCALAPEIEKHQIRDCARRSETRASAVAGRTRPVRDQTLRKLVGRHPTPPDCASRRASRAQQMLPERRLLDESRPPPAAKAVDQHAPRFSARDAAGSQIEERRLIEIADAGAVAALDIVGVDFELGLGVDRRAPAEHQVAAELVRIDLLGVLGRTVMRP